MNLSDLWQGALLVLHPINLAYITFGVLMGFVVGALPGISGPNAMALLMPLALVTRRESTLMLLAAIYSAAITGGSVTAILVNVPGEGPSAATAIDGYKLARQGRAREALAAALLASIVGTAAGALVLLTVAPPLARFALAFGPTEIFLVGLLGLSVIASLSAESVWKGLISGCLGLLLGMVGLDPIKGAPRFTLGQVFLYEGVELMWLIIGLYGITEALMLASGRQEAVPAATGGGFGLPMAQIARKMWEEKVLVIYCAVLGVVVGIIPGAGATIAAWLGYSEGRRFAKHPERFGSGELAGVIAPETANNATEGGALIPALTLGLPGSGSAAILLGGVVAAGLPPGYRLFAEHGPVVYGLILSIFAAAILQRVLGSVSFGLLAKITLVRPAILSALVLALSVVGAYVVRESMLGVGVTLILGVAGFVLRIAGFPLPPILMGLILAPMIEANYYRSWLMGEASLAYILSQPLPLAILILALVGVVTSLKAIRAARRASAVG
jgi:putative tricarboxylic transport membrane protein